MSNPLPIPETVNVHLWPRCNLRCHYCYGQFPEKPRTLPLAAWSAIARALATAGVRRLNFSGGEPTLHPDMVGIARTTRELGLLTSIVTNGARLSAELLAVMDVVALSIDAGDDAGNARVGRIGPSGRSYVEHIESAAARVRAAGSGLKLNTVVTQLNLDADLTALCRRLRPDKFKLLQFVSVEGENAERAQELAVSREEFARFVDRHRALERDGIWVQPESADTIASSYVMVDPSGRLFQHQGGRHVRSRPLPDTTFEAALQAVGGYDRDVFEARGGALSVRRLPLLPRREA